MNNTYKTPGLFLDRDGIINQDDDYVYRIEDFIINEGIYKVIRCAKNYGLKVIVVTNQSGIGRGMFSEKDFNKLTSWMMSKFNENNASIDKVYFSPNHPSKGKGKYKKEDYDRKPNPGMILKAESEFNISLENSVLIGDMESDIKAARNAGIKNIIHFKECHDNSEIVRINKDLYQTSSFESISKFLTQKYN